MTKYRALQGDEIPIKGDEYRIKGSRTWYVCKRDCSRSVRDQECIAYRRRMRQQRVYVAGPIGTDRKKYPERAERAFELADEIMDLGLRTFVPHWCIAQHVCCPRTRKEWLNYTLHELEICDALIYLPGESPGTRAEVKWMRAHGRPVLSTLEELYNWYQST